MPLAPAVADLIRHAEDRPDAPAVALGAETLWTFADLKDRVSRRASAFAARGLGSGSRIAILSANAPAYIETLLAIWWCGAAAVPINARLAEAETTWILTHSEANLICASAALTPQAAASGVPVVTMSGADWEDLLEPAPPTEIDDTDLAWLFYTSGTTGRPKGAMITHRNLDAACKGYLASVDPEAPWPAILHPSPMSHGSGLYALPILRQGGVQVIPASGGFQEAELETLIATWPGSVFFAAPAILRRLVATGADLAPLKAAIYGGAPMPVADIDAFLEAYGPKLAQLYGQGEAPMTISALTRRQLGTGDERLKASAGYAQEGVEVAILDSDGTPLPTDTSGEVAVRGDIVCAGYWKNLEATVQTFAGGWLRTGDVGRIDADGLLTLVDRSKDLIISGGYNIYPREVEEVLATHPNVTEVAVIGRADPVYGETVVACVVGTATEAELDALCLAQIARYKRPRAYRYLSELPRNAYGKVLKRQLRED
ncbi:class I adenylate-forming enzyme family protein [Pseudaestuariivita sp.]|uniref:class I adenylate-forming enzyme family protein n=1 Tax=Pseudaestuariivita sp. TaxID=2211669 RepID=UPI0040587E6E